MSFNSSPFYLTSFSNSPYSWPQSSGGPPLNQSPHHPHHPHPHHPHHHPAQHPHHHHPMQQHPPPPPHHHHPHLHHPSPHAPQHPAHHSYPHPSYMGGPHHNLVDPRSASMPFSPSTPTFPRLNDGSIGVFSPPSSKTIK
eukprot:TRINITY_DN6962_c0_g1_i13.p1 TRINITY_DN6962_c0_g1~~TRINITY_DN6962_c0_g1_i13.p1  ORF type:complete len:160 (-),score=23.38 TRINITY_DN6962_c0_g1_i13:121-540(-)